MKRLVLVALLAACSPSFEQPDAGVVIASLQLGDSVVVVVRGQSATVHVSIFEEQGGAPLHLSLGTLPAGITSTDVDWQPSQGNAVDLTVTAASDAPDVTLPFTLTATADGAIAGSQSGTLSVSELAGSPDPTFGQNGVTSLAQIGFDAKIVGLHQQTSGAWILAGFDAGGPQVFPVLIRVLANGALDPSFGEGGVRQLSFPQGLGITTLGAVAFAPDDRIVLGLARGTDGTVATVDPTGIVTNETPASAPPVALAWDGTDLFVATGSEIDHGSFSTGSPFALAAMRTSGSGTVIAYGRGPTGVARFVADASGVRADATYASAGFLGLPTSQTTTLEPAPFDVDAQGRTLVGLDTFQIARIDSNGALVPTWGQNGLAALAGASNTAPFWIHALSSGGAVVIGVASQYLVTMLDASGAAVPFGTYGRTLLGANHSPEAAAVDASETRVCIAEESSTAGLVLACYRLKP